MKAKIFTKNFCPYCTAVRRTLEDKKIEFTEVNLEENPDMLAELKERTGHKTVPLVFIDDNFIGGFEEFKNHFALKDLVADTSSTKNS